MMQAAVYRVAGFLVMLSATVFILSHRKGGRHEKLSGWRRIRTGLILVTSGLALTNLEFLVHGGMTIPYDIVQYVGLYFGGIAAVVSGLSQFIGAIPEEREEPEKARTTESVDDRTEEFSRHLLKLEENSMALASPGSVQEILHLIVSKGEEISGAYLAVLMLFDQYSNTVNSGHYSGRGLKGFEKLVSTFDLNPRAIELSPEKMYFLKELCRSRRIYSGTDMNEFLSFFTGERPQAESLGLSDVKRFVLVPLQIGGKADGLLCYLFVDDKCPEVLLELFGHQCSLALRNSRLFEQMQQNAIALEVQRRRAENANRSKSEFLANMSHELRTPLNAVIGFSEILHTDLSDMTPEMAQQFIDNINSSGRHLLVLVNDLLDLSRLEIGRLKLERSHFALSEELKQAVKIVEPMAQEKNISLVTDFQEPVEDIFADPQKLRQIIINLLSNAVKFSHTNGKINLKVWKKESAIYFCVEDFGMGIKSEDIDRLFKPFEQLTQNPYARKFRGVGLGLALTRRLVELHGGRVWAESQLGEGSKFFFTVPQ